LSKSFLDIFILLIMVKLRKLSAPCWTV